jgi:hypothetical protein
VLDDKADVPEDGFINCVRIFDVSRIYALGWKIGDGARLASGQVIA